MDLSKKLYYYIGRPIYGMQDILENDDVKLDSMFVASLLMDLIKVA